MFGDNWNVLLAPFNTGYQNLRDHLNAANLEISEENMGSFKTPFLCKNEKFSFSVMDPEEFTAVILPQNFKEGELLLTPVEYKQIFNLWNSIFKKMQEKIADKKLTSD